MWASKILPKVIVHRNKKGTVLFSIHARSRGLKGNVQHDLYDLVDFMGELDIEIECDGVQVKPTMILKIYCKLGAADSSSARRNHALAAARANSPFLS